MLEKKINSVLRNGWPIRGAEIHQLKDAYVEDSALVQKKRMIESLQPVLIGDCPFGWTIKLSN